MSLSPLLDCHHRPPPQPAAQSNAVIAGPDGAGIEEHAPAALERGLQCEEPVGSHMGGIVDQLGPPNRPFADAGFRHEPLKRPSEKRTCGAMLSTCNHFIAP
jgi:hypothetical protein